MKSIQKVNLKNKLSQFTEHWTPKIVGELNGQQLKLVKLKGEFVWHQHDKEDELFYVIDGQLLIELEETTIELNPGEFVIIPKGKSHKPFAPEETSVMLFEPDSTLNTGDKLNAKTKQNLDRI